jgi:hypothetical protein
MLDHRGATEMARSGDNKTVLSLLFGIFSLGAWIIPLFGIPLAIAGLVFGIKGFAHSRTKAARIGIVLSIIGLVLSAANAAIGAYLGATGQHTLVNQLFK